ncbi:kinase-like domain-containing protein [Gautieria morchelliformis]|nr:kinase-like domain-containing protein [Gautieria morchelliformis]
MQLTVTEVLTMDYVARNTSIPIPRILDAFLAREYQGKVYVVMEFIPGVELEVVWKRMLGSGEIPCSGSGAIFPNCVSSRIYVQDHSDMFDSKDVLDKTATRTYATAFTHGDIAPRNILVKNKKIVAILDWESAGWYPEYWKYTRTSMANLYIPDFWEMFRTDGLEVVYPDEFIVDHTTANEFFQGRVASISLYMIYAISRSGIGYTSVQLLYA